MEKKKYYTPEATGTVSIVFETHQSQNGIYKVQDFDGDGKKDIDGYKDGKWYDWDNDDGI